MIHGQEPLWWFPWWPCLARSLWLKWSESPASWQRLSPPLLPRPRVFFFFFLQNHCHCTPATGTEISQPVARRAVGVRMCQARPSGPAPGCWARWEQEDSSFFSVSRCHFAWSPGYFYLIFCQGAVSPNWCHCQCHFIIVTGHELKNDWTPTLIK